MRKERIKGFNFERIILAIGIIAYHFSVSSIADKKLFMDINGWDTGIIITRTFFILSGAMLYYNNENIESLPKFYLKRFKSIFPPFWIAYFIEFCKNAISTRTLFWSGQSPWKIILSILGVDGYFSYLGRNYYIIGEWFLGALIILYLIYPLLLWLMKKNTIITSIGVAGLFVLFLSHKITFKIPTAWNLIFCGVCFYLGMVVMKYKKYLFDNKVVTIIASILCILIFTIKIPVNSLVIFVILGYCLFIVLQRIGSLLDKCSFMEKSLKALADISFEIFLVQHIVILSALSIYNPTGTKEAALYLVIITILCIIYAKLLHATVDGLLGKRQANTNNEQKAINASDG